MRSLGPCLTALLFFILALPAFSDAPVSCTSGARSFYPCDLTYQWQDAELAANFSPYKDDLLSVEFRSPSAKTYLLRAFWSADHTLSVRFSPTEPGAWATRITSTLKRYDGQQGTMNVTDSGHPGFVDVANVRHWRTTNKQPHLWLGAGLPTLQLDTGTLSAWLDSRKHDGFTHIRTTLLTASASRQPWTAAGLPDLGYFEALDQQLLAVANRGFTLDLILADSGILKSPAFSSDTGRESLVRYLIARYGALNLTWQGIARFDELAGSRDTLRNIAQLLGQFDPYRHPRSSDAAVSSSPLLPDGWMNFLIEASPHPEVGAVEHQFTQSPQIHILTATDPKLFRHELWNCTANGEYPSVSYESLNNEANVRAVQVWQKLISDTRHWEFEPYFDVSGARAVGLDEVEYVAYAQEPGIVEISLQKHKYNPLWVNPTTGEELPLKDYKGEVFSRQTPDNEHDWILQVPRNGHKESMRSYRFDSVDPPVQEVESDPAKLPFALVDPSGEEMSATIPVPFKLKLTKSNRSTRTMQYLWWGEVIAGGEGPRLLAIGPAGNLAIPQILLRGKAETLNLRIQAINSNGKAYEIDKVYQLR